MYLASQRIEQSAVPWNKAIGGSNGTDSWKDGHKTNNSGEKSGRDSSPSITLQNQDPSFTMIEALILVTQIACRWEQLIVSSQKMCTLCIGKSHITSRKWIGKDLDHWNGLQALANYTCSTANGQPSSKQVNDRVFTLTERDLKPNNGIPKS